MSLLGFDAIGHLAIGHPKDAATVTALVVTTASYAVTANAVTFRLTENISPAAYVVSPQGVTEKQIEAVSSASFAVTANAASLRIIASPAPAAFILTTYPTTEFENEVVAPASFALKFNNVPLIRTGFDYDVQQGGVGHYKLDLERARQLARMARKVPPPIDLRTAPQFKATGSPPMAPALPAPMMPPAPDQRMGEAAAMAKAAKQRRDIEAILLLAS